VIPQTSTSLTSVPTMTSHASMPCLFTAISSLDGCAECRKWERDYESLCNQLDDKDDELTERSKEILELESQLRDSRQEVTSLTENNKTITEEFADVQARLDSSQSEVKDAFVVVDTLAVSYDEKESELVTKMQENEDLMLKMAQLEAEVLRTREELSQTKVRLDHSKKQTLDMFLDLFNDFSHASTPDNLKPSLAADMYKSSPNLNTADPMMTSTMSNSTLSSSSSAHSALSRESDESLGYRSRSHIDLSSPLASPTTENVMMQSIYSSPNNTYTQGSRVFHEKVSDLKTRLTSLLETNYSQVISSSDTPSSFARNIKMRKSRPRTGGRVFTVFSRATPRKYNHSLTDSIIPIQLGKREF